MLKLNRKGQTLTSHIMGAIVVSVFLLLAIYVVSQIINSMPTPTGTLQTAFNQTITNISAGLTLGAILPIVLFAAIILAAIIGYFYLKR